MKIENMLKYVKNKFHKTYIPEKTQIFGNTVFLQKKGPQFRELAQHGIWEKETTEYVQEHVKEGCVCLDIGANIGYFTLLFANLVRDTGKVYSFEPEPSNFHLLSKNVTTNNFKNIIFENLAVTNEACSVNLFLSKTGAGQHRIYPSKATSKNFVNVKGINLDKYFQNSAYLNKISFAKIDVEGSEFGVIKGMKNILEKNNIELILEFSPQQIEDFGSNPLELLEYLEEFNFKFYSITNGGIPKKFGELKKIIKYYKGTSRNLLCKKL